MHVGTSSNGTLGYIEIPLTTVVPPHYIISDLNTLNNSLLHIYLPEIFEPINVDYQDMKQIDNCFQVNHFDLYKYPTLNINVCNEQPSQKLPPRMFPPLPYSRKI